MAPRRQPRPLKGERTIASFDSAPATLQSVAACLQGRSYSVSGLSSPAAARAAASVGATLNLLPARARRKLYARSGVLETVAPRDAGRVSAEEAATWLVRQVPRRAFPAVVIGSGGGAVAHLCAALGVPFLPQNLLVALRQPGRHVDDARAEVSDNRDASDCLLSGNPKVALHHMQDPNQDRLMLSSISYMRLKWRQLPNAYEQFLGEVLPRGATILVTDCRLSWPTTRYGDRHVFQFGGVGGLSSDQYRSSSVRVSNYLRADKSPVGAWNPPEPDGDSPEAEWGFDSALLDDLCRLADRRGWTVQRLTYPEPDSLSGPVAALYRAWYSSHGLPLDRVLLSSFALLDPWTALRTKSVPFWTTFSVQPAVERVRAHLAGHAYEEIAWTAFPHGIESIGFAPLDAWAQTIATVPRRRLLGLDHRRFPADLAAFARYRADLETLPTRGGALPAVTLGQARDLLQGAEGVEWRKAL